MSALFNINAPKKPTNLTVNSDLLSQAKEHKINISATLENALVEVLKEKKSELWKKENREAMASYNEKIGETGLFSDGIRFV